MIEPAALLDQELLELLEFILFRVTLPVAAFYCGYGAIVSPERSNLFLLASGAALCGLGAFLHYSVAGGLISPFDVAGFPGPTLIVIAGFIPLLVARLYAPRLDG